MHVFLAAAGLFKSYQLKVLNNKWNKLAPQREMLKNLTKEYEVLSADARIIQQLNLRRLNWAEKVNKLSLDLPAGIWFNELSFSRKDFILKGSVISLQKEEMNLVNKFIYNLKKDVAFFKDFSNLELSSVQIRTVGGYDIFDFVLAGKLNPARNTK
jgi:Tfp pilus assembly protein PilN